jgi:hypothetical protein
MNISFSQSIMRQLTTTLLTVVVSAASCLAALGAETRSETAKVDVTCRVPKAVASFSGTLVLRLYKIHPMIADKAADLVDTVEVKNFSHTEGVDTQKAFVVGAQAILDPAMKYYITCMVLDAKGTRTHMGESPDRQSSWKVLTQGNPNQAGFTVRKL